MNYLKLFVTVLLFGFASFVMAQTIATLRSQDQIDQQSKTEAIASPTADDKKVARNYPMQPPIIPHNIRNYQVDLRANACLSCHSRKRVGESQATMISVTHYMDRDGNFLADISPRRYFCNQCHVQQHDAKPLVANQFVDMDSLLKIRQEKAAQNVEGKVQ
jgi:cytochrome c-type protein NapB